MKNLFIIVMVVFSTNLFSQTASTTTLYRNEVPQPVTWKLLENSSKISINNIVYPFQLAFQDINSIIGYAYRKNEKTKTTTRFKVVIVFVAVKNINIYNSKDELVEKFDSYKDDN